MRLVATKNCSDAWVGQACRQSLIDVNEIMAHDNAIVRQQRNSRGSLFGWLMQSIRPNCDTCDLPLFQQAQLYMDEMLRALVQASFIRAGRCSGPQPRKIAGMVRRRRLCAMHNPASLAARQYV